MPRVSIIIPTCDRNPIPTIESILNQTYQNFEIIVVNDGTKEIWGDLRTLFKSKDFNQFTLVSHLQKYRGASATRNEGIKSSSRSSEYIACIDSDDQIYPEHLRTLVTYLDKHPEIDIAFSCSWGILEPNCDTIRAEVWIEDLPGGKKKGVLPAPYYQTENIFRDNPAPLLNYLTRRKCFEQAGLFDENLVVLNDFELFNRFFLAGFNFSFVDQFTGEYSIHGKGINSNNPEEAQRIAWAIRRRSQCKAWRKGLVRRK